MPSREFLAFNIGATVLSKPPRSCHPKEIKAIAKIKFLMPEKAALLYPSKPPTEK